MVDGRCRRERLARPGSGADAGGDGTGERRSAEHRSGGASSLSRARCDVLGGSLGALQAMSCDGWDRSRARQKAHRAGETTVRGSAAARGRMDAAAGSTPTSFERRVKQRQHEAKVTSRRRVHRDGHRGRPRTCRQHATLAAHRPELPGLACQSLRVVRGRAGRLDVGVGAGPEAGGVDVHRPRRCGTGRDEPARAGWLRPPWTACSLVTAGSVHQLPHRVETAVLPGLVQLRQLPRTEGEQRDAARPGAPHLSLEHQQPGVEDGARVADLHVLEQRRVQRPGAVVEGHEHHPPAGPDRWRLGRDLHPGDQHLLLAAAAQQVARPGWCRARAGTGRSRPARAR